MTSHQRFALRDVTFAGSEMPGATVDRWEQAGAARWSVRLVTRHPPSVDVGELVGRTSDGRIVSGQAVVAGREAGGSARREVLVVFHGSGPLHGL